MHFPLGRKIVEIYPKTSEPEIVALGVTHPIRDAPVKQRDPDRGDSRRDTRNVWAIVFCGHLPGKYFTNPDSEIIDNHRSG